MTRPMTALTLAAALLLSSCATLRPAPPAGLEIYRQIQVGNLPDSPASAQQWLDALSFDASRVCLAATLATGATPPECVAYVGWRAEAQQVIDAWSVCVGSSSACLDAALAAYEDRLGGEQIARLKALLVLLYGVDLAPATERPSTETGDLYLRVQCVGPEGERLDAKVTVARSLVIACAEGWTPKFRGDSPVVNVRVDPEQEPCTVSPCPPPLRSWEGLLEFVDPATSGQGPRPMATAPRVLVGTVRIER